MNPWPIAPITDKDLNFAVVNYDFIDLTAGELADLPNIEANLDTVIFDFATSITGQLALSPSLDGDLNDLAAILTEVEQADFSSIIVDLAGIAAAGDGMLTDFANLIGG